MAALLLDENVSERLVEPLTVFKHDVVSVGGLGHKGRVDADILLIATGLRRAVVTHNRSHFQALHEAWILWTKTWETPQFRHAGIIVVRSGPGVTDAEIAAGIDAGIRQEARSLSNRCLGWDYARGWFEVLVRT